MLDGRPGAGSVSGERAREVSVVRVRGAAGCRRNDLLTVEEPLEIRVCHAGAAAADGERSVAVTMRTPGHDHELAAGFLFCEGFFKRPEELAGVSYCGREGNVVRVTLTGAPDRATARGTDARGNLLAATSSCGVCGKASIDDVLATLPEPVAQTAHGAAAPAVPAAVLHRLPEELRRHQRTFAQTGGLHAAALFEPDGRLQLLREDVGRHNALDKLIGRAVLEARLPLPEAVILFSGRTGFELVQKAACAGIRRQRAGPPGGPHWKRRRATRSWRWWTAPAACRCRATTCAPWEWKAANGCRWRWRRTASCCGARPKSRDRQCQGRLKPETAGTCWRRAATISTRTCIGRAGRWQASNF